MFSILEGKNINHEALQDCLELGSTSILCPELQGMVFVVKVDYTVAYYCKWSASPIPHAPLSINRWHILVAGDALLSWASLAPLGMRLSRRYVARDFV